MMRRTCALVLSMVLGIAAAPLLADSQEPSARFGALTGALPPDATVGARGGPLPAGATVGALTGALPPDATVGARGGPLPAGATVGALTGALPPDARVGARGGALPAGATVGALTGSLPPGTRVGEPGPSDLAHGLERLAETYLTDAQYAHAEQLLRQSVMTREEELGPDHPEVAKALERHAALLRTRNREAAAVEMEARAMAIRAKPDSR